MNISVLRQNNWLLDDEYDIIWFSNMIRKLIGPSESN